MNEILQKRIEEAAENHEQHYNVGEEHGYLYTHKGDIKEAVIYGATFALQNQWISVEEALPKENGRYLVYAPTYKKGSSSGLDFKDGIGFSRFCNGKWSIEIGYHKRPNCVTHWAPIPEMKGGEE